MNKSNCFCEKCNYKAKCISDYNKHLLSKKHNNQEELEYNYECKNCNKKYKCSSGLWYHKKTCHVVIQETPKISNELKEIKEQNQQHQKEIKEQNQQHQKEIEELKKLIIELINK